MHPLWCFRIIKAEVFGVGVAYASSEPLSA
jgi:hypothetical protein